MAQIGIDISAHQGDIDLEALKNQIAFVIIRVGYGTKGTIDKKFTRNVELCKSLGIPVGFYWYSYALNVAQAETEAEAFVKVITPYMDICKYGAWFDMEDADSYKQKNGMPSNQTLREMCAAFCKIVEDSGFYAGIYASQSWFNEQLNGEEIKPYDKWVAQWPVSGGKQAGLNVTAEQGLDKSLWQFTSEGKFTGYNDTLDTNYAYKEFPNPGNKQEIVTEETVVTTETTETVTQKFAIGDKVTINGSLYTSANADSPAGNVSNKITNITRYSVGSAHPYNTTGDLGWMNESDITAYTEVATATATITKGSRVKFTGTTSYSGIHLASWVTNSTFDVIEVSGDRVVIGKGTAVTAAVKMSDCQGV
jgi:GH25 family lysozyme M1 (1,4-beta-N-acetylmuramidase)